MVFLFSLRIQFHEIDICQRTCTEWNIHIYMWKKVVDGPWKLEDYEMPIKILKATILGSERFESNLSHNSTTDQPSLSSCFSPIFVLYLNKPERLLLQREKGAASKLFLIRDVPRASFCSTKRSQSFSFIDFTSYRHLCFHFFLLPVSP